MPKQITQYEKIVLGGIEFYFKDLFSVLDDYVFKAVMEDIELAEGLLSALLDKDVHLRDVDRTPFVESTGYGHRNLVLDLL
jgi:hypothetical protein